MKIVTVDRVVTDSQLRSSFHELNQPKPKYFNIRTFIKQQPEPANIKSDVKNLK